MKICGNYGWSTETGAPALKKKKKHVDSKSFEKKKFEWLGNMIKMYLSTLMISFLEIPKWLGKSKTVRIGPMLPSQKNKLSHLVFFSLSRIYIRTFASEEI